MKFNSMKFNEHQKKHTTSMEHRMRKKKTEANWCCKNIVLSVRVNGNGRRFTDILCYLCLCYVAKSH